ncbi:hypothetical protein AKJ09_07849 [Labilithrix luteola]|uniref:Uncharacterized protein n=1 Tax=Labilithrix luteola TaxID=1391654 RepID=A0A0K1Q5T1_9BACT|nr:hypothetical protein AKJ09_07849 [Labilithrix luteola]
MVPRGPTGRQGEPGKSSRFCDVFCVTETPPSRKPEFSPCPAPC